MARDKAAPAPRGVPAPKPAGDAKPEGAAKPDRDAKPTDEGAAKPDAGEKPAGGEAAKPGETRLPPDAPKIDAPVKPVPQEPTKEERDMARGQQQPTTAADWALRKDPEARAAETPDKAAERDSKLAGPTQATIGFGSPAIDAPGGLASAARTPKHLLELSGYAILGAHWTQQDAQLLYVGRNNGFSLANARLQITARPAEQIWLFMSLEGAVANPSSTDPTRGRREVRLRDAYGIWAPQGHLRVQAGQFKAPQGVEELLEEVEVRFASRSIVTNGTGAPFAYVADPLTIGRQLGIGVGTDRIPLGAGGFIAQIAVMNGNGAENIYNDAPYPSVSARAAYDRGGVSFGAWGSFQPRAFGDQPLVYRDNVFSTGVDVLVKRGPFHAMLLGTLRSTRHVTSRQPDEVALGVSGEAAYRIGFIEPALRVSFLEPTDQVPTDALVNTTVGLNFYIPGAPGRLTVNYTNRIEQSGRSLTNDSLELQAQVRF